MMALSWKAKRRGKLYCAPACGRGCTWAEHKRAKKRGEKLAKRLGEGWTYEVRENLGWHYEAVSPCGLLKVCEYRYSGKVTGYTAFLATQPGQTGGLFTKHGDTPREAVENTVAVGVEARDRLIAVLEGLDS